ncbi:MAG: Glycosyl transferase group 1, partial [Parcubacteria group bacterium GW2011_GWC2_45_7]
MRILQVNKYLYRRAGAEAYVLDWAELLIKHGQETGLWGTEAFPCHSEGAQRLKNPVHKGTGSFASAQDDVVIFNDLLVEERHFDQREGFWRDIKKVGHMIWSWESVRKFEEVLQRFKPDIVHIHNIYHHISPSILPMAKRFGVPVVMTVHDYHLINPNYNLYDHGEICERKGIYAIAHKCIKDSYAASFADVLEWGIHKMLRVYDNNVARYVVPTEFVKEKLVEQGIGGRHIEVVPLPVILNGVQCSEEFRANARDGRTYMRDSLLPAVAQNDSNGGYVLFAGRITREKGVYLLLEMAKKLPEMQFKIAGTGPELTNVKLKIKNEKLENIELLGF